MLKRFEDLLNKTLTKIENRGDRLDFTLDNGEQYCLYHDQSCCESVTIEDIIGELNDLLGSPVLMAECITSEENPKGIDKEYQQSFTWTFYKLATIRGYVTIRWYGESNGYYSERVDWGNLENNRIIYD